jgi:KRAB domain-containing zinc finger protein
MFSCERCDKEFTEKRNLTRHQKTHLLSTEAYTCDACGKDFDREDARNRHMKTHLKDSTASG